MARGEGGGRPKAKIDIDLIKKCAEKHWSIAEIAAVTKVHRSTLERRFAEVIEEARESGRAKLRDLQWKRALEGSDRVLLHMSEHYLQQQRTEKRELTGKDGAPLPAPVAQVIVELPAKDVAKD